MASPRVPTVQIEVDRSSTAPMERPDLPAAVMQGTAQPYAEWLLQQLGEQGLTISAGGAPVQMVATASGTGARVLLANHAPQSREEVLLRIGGMAPGMKRLSVYRIDAACRWRHGRLVPMEVRETPDPDGKHEQTLLLPALSAALVCLDQVLVRAQV